MTNGNLVAGIALSFVGATKYSAKHREIINTFNTLKPHGYKASTSDPWCAESWTAWQIMAGNTAKEVPMSASCSQIIADAKSLGIWKEDDSFKPSIGDAILYDWQDSGKGDNTGSPDHIGIVYAVDSKYIYVVEGNKGSASTCGKRAVLINGRYIRGFVHPKYAALKKSIYKPSTKYTGKVPTNDVMYGTKGADTKALQTFLNWCIGSGLAVDSSAGKATISAVITFQYTNGLDADGIFGPKSRAKANEIIKKYSGIVPEVKKGYTGTFPDIKKRTVRILQARGDRKLWDIPYAYSKTKTAAHHWTVVLRPAKNQTKIVEGMQKIADNKLITYKQSSALYGAAEKVGFDGSKIKSKVQGNCTTMACVALHYAGYTKAPKTFNAKNSVSVLTPLGCTAYTASKYLTSSEYLKNGDFLVAESCPHIAVAKVTETYGLRYGDEGENVKLLQKFLNWYGSYSLVVDGSFGDKTLSAVKDFQTKTGLAVDGVFGEKSLAKAKAVVK